MKRFFQRSFLWNTPFVRCIFSTNHILAKYWRYWISRYWSQLGKYFLRPSIKKVKRLEQVTAATLSDELIWVIICGEMQWNCNEKYLYIIVMSCKKCGTKNILSSYIQNYFNSMPIHQMSIFILVIIWIHPHLRNCSNSRKWCHNDATLPLFIDN